MSEQSPSQHPKNPANQKAPESSSGRWARRHEKIFKRSPQLDTQAGKYKKGGDLVARPGKTAWDRSGKKD